MGLLSHVNSFYVFDFFDGLFRSISIIRSWSKKSPLRLHNIIELLDFVIIYAINRSHDHNNEKQNLTVVSMTTFLKKKMIYVLYILICISTVNQLCTLIIKYSFM